jgi:hypothetical protein
MGIDSSLTELQQEAPEEKRDYHHDNDVHSGTSCGYRMTMCESRRRESVAH